MIKKCLFCGTTITSQNNTDEHIIPSFLGGTKKIRNFICKSCNNTTGHKYDSQLAKQLEQFTVYLGVKGDRNKKTKHQYLTTKGNNVYLTNDGVLYKGFKFKEKTLEEGIQFDISAANSKMIKKKLNELKRKYPQIDCQLALQNLNETTQYLPRDEHLLFSCALGENGSDKSIVKTALSMVFSTLNSVEFCNIAKNHLFDEGEGKSCYRLFYDFDIIGIKNFLPLNCVSVYGNEIENSIFCYIEYLGIYKILLHLSDNFDGKNFSSTYAFNSLTGENLNVSVNLDKITNKIFYQYPSEDQVISGLKKSFSDFMSFAFTESRNREISRIVNRSFEKWYKQNNKKNDEPLSDEEYQNLIGFITNEFMPFIMNNVTSPSDH